MAYFKKPAQKQVVNERRVYNNLHVGTTNPFKTFYTFLNVDGKDHYFEYIGKFRVEATAFFEEIAREYGTKYNGNLYTLKN